MIGNLLAIAGLLAATVAIAFGIRAAWRTGKPLVRWPVALLGWVPWLVLRSPSPRPPRVAARAVARRFLNDAVVEAGMVSGSIRNRIVVL